MKRALFSLVLTLVSGQLLHSQQLTQRTCGTEILPAEYEQWLQSKMPSGKYSDNLTQSVFNIPVIVHIIHNNEPVNSVSATSGNNLNAAQVLDQINILNKDFNGQNADTNLIPAVFKPLLGKFQINFCLAVVNPTGGVLAEPGIDRINRNTKGWNNGPYTSNYFTGTIKPNSIWDPTRYFNIWVAPLTSGLLGYATFPAPGTSSLQGLTGAFGTATTDGVVILNTAFGSIGTAQGGQYNKGRTATHEIGHWLGLRHIWGDNTCGNDFVSDTPPAQNANYGCFSHPYKLGTCTGNTTGEMTMNYMDYSNDACLYMFTREQENRAQLILVHSPMRTALLSSTVCNLPSTTTDIGITYVSRPSYSQSVCADSLNPVLHLTNFGTTVLSGATFTYNVDGINTQTLVWTGNVQPNTSFTLALPVINSLSNGPHIFFAGVFNPNGGADVNMNNNTNQQQFLIAGNFAPSVNSNTTCQGTPAMLSASGATSYVWVGAGTGPSLTVNPPVTTVYNLIVSDGYCTANLSATMTVLSAPSLSANSAALCIGNSVTLTASGASTFTWSTGDQSASIVVSPTANTAYTVSSANSQCTVVKVAHVTVSDYPTPYTSQSHVSCSGCTDAMVTVNDTLSSGPFTYSWMPIGAITQQLVNVGVGCYTVMVTNPAGCSVEREACVTFDVGMKELYSEMLVLSPNPNSGTFRIDFENEAVRTVKICDQLGRAVFEKLSTGQRVDIRMELAPGIYYLQVESESKRTSLKLLIE